MEKNSKRTKHTKTIFKKSEILQNSFLAGHWCLTPVILATQEADIRRIEVQSCPGKQFVRAYVEKTQHKKQGWQIGPRCRP
jgi:hypothetical protein